MLIFIEFIFRSLRSSIKRFNLLVNFFYDFKFFILLWRHSIFICLFKNVINNPISYLLICILFERISIDFFIIVINIKVFNLYTYIELILRFSSFCIFFMFHKIIKIFYIFKVICLKLLTILNLGFNEAFIKESFTWSRFSFWSFRIIHSLYYKIIFIQF